MSLTTRISSRFTRIVSAQCRNSSVISTRRHPLSVPSSYFHSLGEPHSKVSLDSVTSIIDGLKRLYVQKLKPLEITYRFNDFVSPLLTNSDFDAKPMIMLLGQYSTGKTTFSVNRRYGFAKQLLINTREMLQYRPLVWVVGGWASLFLHSSLNASASQRLGFSSVPPSPEKPEKENSPLAKGRSTVGNNGAKAKASRNAEAPEQREEPISKDSEKKLTIKAMLKLVIKDMLKLALEKLKLLIAKLEEIEKMQEEVRRSKAALKKDQRAE